MKCDELWQYQKDIDAFDQEIRDIETDLSFSGSTKTISEVQLEYDNLQEKW
jgi:hypothetical protein